jgi:hypothetical protein
VQEVEMGTEELRWPREVRKTETDIIETPYREFESRIPQDNELSSQPFLELMNEMEFPEKRKMMKEKTEDMKEKERVNTKVRRTNIEETYASFPWFFTPSQ